MKNKLIVIGIIILFIGITISAGATTTINLPSKQKGGTITYPYARIEMKNGSMGLFDGLSWHWFPLLNFLNKICGRETYLTLNSHMGLVIIEGELTVKPLVQEEIILHPGDTIYMKVWSGDWNFYLDGQGQAIVTSISGVAFGITIEKNR